MTASTILFFFSLFAFTINVHGMHGDDLKRKIKGGMHGGGKMHLPKAAKQAPQAAKKKEKDTDVPTFSADYLEDLCTLWEVFDNMGRDENNDPAIPGFEWSYLCDDFAPFNDWLCPAEEVVQDGICSHQRPWLNPAIRQYYCGPLLAEMPEGPRRASCETWCTNYVSKDRGHCCNFECNEPY